MPAWIRLSSTYAILANSGFMPYDEGYGLSIEALDEEPTLAGVREELSAQLAGPLGGALDVLCALSRRRVGRQMVRDEVRVAEHPDEEHPRDTGVARMAGGDEVRVERLA